MLLYLRLAVMALMLEPGLNITIKQSSIKKASQALTRDEVDKAGLLEASVIRISDPTSTIVTATNARGGGGQNAAHANLTELRSSATTTSTAASDEETLLGRRYQSPYSIGELLNLVIPPSSVSQDIDMDPCKAGLFIGDIAWPYNNLTQSSKLSSKKMEDFDVRDTISEPRVGTGDHLGKSTRKGKHMKTAALSRHEKHQNWSSQEGKADREGRLAGDLIGQPHPSLRPYTPGNQYPFFSHPKVHPDDKIILIRSGQKAKLPPVKLVNQQQLKLSQDQLSRDQLSQEQLSTPYLQQPQKLVQAQENNGKVWRDVKRIKSKVAAPNTRHFEQKQRLVLMPGQTGLKETSQPGKPVVRPRQETAQSGPGQYSTSQPGQKARQSRPAVGPSDLAAGRSDLEAGRSDLEVGRSDIVAGRSDLAAGQPGGLARLAPTQEQRRQQRLSRRLLMRRRRLRHRARPGTKSKTKNRREGRGRTARARRRDEKRRRRRLRRQRAREAARMKSRRPHTRGTAMLSDDSGIKAGANVGNSATATSAADDIADETEMAINNTITSPRDGLAASTDPRQISKEEPAAAASTNGGVRTKRAATARPERIWDYAVIPYEIDSNFSGVHKALFKQAMRHWENYTCIQFVERTADHPNWIVFTERPCGCCSFVGKRGNGPQAISIGKNCDKFGIVVHELGHVVGFWHEHTRPDRDHWVTIIRENVILGQDYNFNELSPEEVNSLGFKYDYDSIMHYARNTFSKGTYLDTILPRADLPMNQKSMPEIGQRIRLSAGDILQTSALYNCPACGRTYQDTSGKFGSPQFPVYVPPHTFSPHTFKKGDLCQWRILATHGEKIILNITTLDIPSSPNCRRDYLEVRDGYWEKSALLTRICGSTPPQPIISSGSRLMVTYKTHESSPDHKGFKAQYEAVCGGELDTESGQLESPNFPEDYQPNKECIWKISVAADFQVALKFQSFEIENHDNCVYDYLEIRDGATSSSPLIGTYCGYKMPKDIKSSTNSLWIKFVSDGSVQKAGFSASFMKEYDECQSPDHGCQHQCVNTLGGYKCMCRLGYELHSDERRCENACGGLIDTSNGTITSPSFPHIYPSNKNCIWEIIAPPQWRITINFTHFDIEGNNQDCEYDSLAISSKLGSGEARQHGLFCGNRLPPVITSEGNSLRLEFLSDNSVQKNGFAAIFFTDKDECATDNGGCQHVCRNTIGAYYCSCHQGFVLHENGHDCKEGGCKHEITTNKGEISSPHYPDYYPAKKECVWIFSTTAGHRIKLLFTEFELEPHQECAYDHIVVYDGHTTSQQILGRFCGSKLPHPLITTDSSMLLVFKSDASVQRKGFMAEHMTVCGGHLEANSKQNNIYSHAKFGDINYENKEDCDWIIEAPQGHHVHLRFSTFQLEEEQDCGYDFIEVFSGYDDSGPSYGRFCGNKIPPEIISVDEALLLRFKSDDTINSKGFSATYVIIDQTNTKDYEDIYVEQKQ